MIDDCDGRSLYTTVVHYTVLPLHGGSDKAYICGILKICKTVCGYGLCFS